MAKDIQVRKDSSLRTPSAFQGMPEFTDIIEGLFGNRLLGEWPSVSRQAVMNMKETDNGFCLAAEIPGVPQEDIDVNVSGNMLTIRAESKLEEGDESDRGFIHQYRQFQQSFTLPSFIEVDEIQASYENGVLEIYIPKSAKAEPKKIPIHVGKGGVFNRFLGKKGRAELDSDTKHGPAKH